MSEKYIPLYRKYRPQNLQEVVGQEHVKKALTNAINLNKISHAYLFTGPRGTGKTSIARILAKSLNCVQGPTLTPCEVCPSCVDIKNSTPMDVIEIDAASNRKVEDARNILEKIQYIPVNGKYKIYIIDEVHMLTKEAFNTLLKTLEEPPENVIFILATTEPQKVLETITSRCQRFDFRRITTDDIINHLKNIAKSEKIKIEDDALFTIAKNSAGGMRDSLALLDQVSVLDDAKKITSDDVNKLLGRLSFDMLYKFSEKIIQSEPQEAIELLEQIYNSGNEPTQILINLLGYFKNLLIVKNCKGDELLIDLTQLNNSQISALKAQSENIDTHQIVFLIEKTSYYIKELKITTNQHLWLEIATIDLANLAQNTSLLELQERVLKLESGVVKAPQNIMPKIQPPSSIPAKKEEKIEQIVEAKQEKVAEPQKETVEVPEQVSQVETVSTSNKVSWEDFLKQVKTLSPPTLALLSDHASPVELSSKKVVIGCEKEFSLKMLSSDMKKKVIQEAAETLFGEKNINVIIKLLNSNDKVLTSEKKNDVEPKGQEGKNARGQEETILSIPVQPSEQLEEIDEDTDFIEHELAKKNPKKDDFIPSDQVSMVVKLFDGKYIDS